MGCDFSQLVNEDEGSPRSMRLRTGVDSPHRKVIFAGDISVGKSSLIQRLQGKGFREEHVSTIGSAYSQLSFKIKHDAPPLILDVWDTAGEERYRSMSRFFFRNADVGVLVFDVQESRALEDLKAWYDEIWHSAPLAKYVVVGNKIDCSATLRKVTTEQGQAFAASINASYVETSARLDDGIKNMLHCIIRGLALESDEHFDKDTL